jgi:antitoxin component YwqK of YwqJK toxin-antitoxin module
MEGLCQWWHDNGQPSNRYNCVADKREGPYIEWYTDGTLKESGNYLAGEIVSQ